jgi:hypothetical protein
MIFLKTLIGHRGAGFILATSLLVGCTILATTPTPVPTNIPSPTDTPDPCTGWWCTVSGVVYVDAVDPGNELEGASVELNHSSYCSPTEGQYQTTTGPDGTFEFSDVFFHDTDRVWIQVDSEGYGSARWDSVGVYCYYCSCFTSPIEIVLRSAPGQ